MLKKNQRDGGEKFRTQATWNRNIGMGILPAMLEKLKNEIEGRGVRIPARIPVQGTFNFRDVGLYSTSDGKPLRRGVFYRADNLGRLTKEGREAVITIGVGTVIDLRTEQERLVHPNRLSDDPRVAFHEIDLVGDSHEIISRGDTIVNNSTEERLPDGMFADPVGRLVLIYSTILDYQQPMIRRAIEVLAGFELTGTEVPSPAVFHCVAGQDRTGLIAALLLSIAGVDERVIVFDYAATAYYNSRRYRVENGRQWWGMAIETPEEYGAQFCPAGAMEGTLLHLDEHYGGAVSYLRTVGVDESAIDRIRRRLVGDGGE